MHEFSNSLIRLKPTSNLNTVSRTSHRNKRHVLLEIIVVVWNHAQNIVKFHFIIIRKETISLIFKNSVLIQIVFNFLFKYILERFLFFHKD